MADVKQFSPNDGALRVWEERVMGMQRIVFRST